MELLLLIRSAHIPVDIPQGGMSNPPISMESSQTTSQVCHTCLPTTMSSTRAHPSFTIAETEYQHGDTAVVLAPEKHTLAIAKRDFEALSA